MPATTRILYQRPLVSLARSTSARMWLVSLCAGLAVLQSALTDSFSSLFIALAAVAAALLSELLVNRPLKLRTVQDGSAVASALVLALLLPNQINPALAALGAVFAMVVVKHSFGGLGTNWLNPAVAGWLFIRFSWPAAFDTALESSPLTVLSALLRSGAWDAGGSPLNILTAGGGSFSVPAQTIATVLSSAVNTGYSALNHMILSFSGAELSGDYLNLFISGGPGIIADRGLFALLLGTIIITASQANRAWIPAVFLAVYTLLVRFFGALPMGGALGNGDMIFGLCSGGVIAAAFLLVSDPATGPKSVIGAAAVAAATGLLAFFLRYAGIEPYGAFFAVALMNTLIPRIRDFENRRVYMKGGRR
ncbi:hypothetical protein AGMMS50267_00150 [Spirochaetia bacterium]|nr:hypothetical protein AGMMS50267_00150 [Spirochaetia bacterium]